MVQMWWIFVQEFDDKSKSDKLKFQMVSNNEYDFD